MVELLFKVLEAMELKDLIALLQKITSDNEVEGFVFVKEEITFIVWNQKVEGTSLTEKKKMTIGPLDFEHFGHLPLILPFSNNGTEGLVVKVQHLH